MALASFLSKGQIPVDCQLCEGGSKIQWRCCDCDVLMCTKCKEKVHSKFKNFNNHRIIDIHEVGQQDSEETITFSDVHCKQHLNQPCCLFCKTCKELVCPKCLMKTHNGHNFADEEEYEIKREEIREAKTIIDENLNHLKKLKDEFSKIKKYEFSKYNESKNNILAQKMAVEKFVDELLNELDVKWKQVNQDLEGKQNELDKMEKVLQEQNTTMDELIKSKEVVKFFEKSDTFLIPLDEIDAKRIRKCNAMPTFFPGEVTKNIIGTFKIVDIPVEEENKIELKVVRQFTSDLRSIHYTAVCSDGSLWIGNDKLQLLQHIQIKGDNIQELLRLNTNVYDMAVTPGDELLISGESTVKLVSKNGEIKDSPYSVAPLVPRAIHVNSSYKVIIGARIPGKPFPGSGVVIMMDQKGKRLAEYELDSNKEPLFTVPRFITTTSKGNICVVDRLDSGGRGRVVVLSPTGDVITTYSGHSDINNEEPFKPSNIITTALHNLVVVERENHTIHILDSEGHFITYYSTKDLGIINPCSVALSSTGNLYIGCVCLLQDPDSVRSKLYEVEFFRF